MAPFQNSYIITNRNTPNSTACTNIYPLSNSELWFYTASVQYDAEVTDYTAIGSSSQTAPAAFTTALTADLVIAAANASQPGGPAAAPQLTVLIHGLGNTFAQSISELSVVGLGLQQYGNYPGLVISFDWPSFDILDSVLFYSTAPYSFPPANTSGTIRDNINGSVGAFGNLVSMLLSLQASLPTLQVNVICHSEGNYMAMLGFAAAAQTVFLNQVLLVAADINSGALQLGTVPTGVGQGVPITTAANRVSVYYSANDDVLPISQQLFSWLHNPSFPNRLGLSGPNSFGKGALSTGTFGIDCSAVITESHAPPGITSHSSYFYIPQVLTDWSQTLLGASAPTVVNRTANPDAADGQGFVMNYVPATGSPVNRYAGRTRL